MLAHLKGRILKKTDKGVILSTGNIGYFVYMKTNLLAEMEENQETELFIHSQIREDAFDLYGFTNYQELTFFKKLIGINGIGPKVALEILSVPTEKIKAAIINEDIEYMKKIPGIGPKTAKRIILELKGKIETEYLDREYKNIAPETKNDVVDALTRLGYQKHQIIKALKDIPETIKEDKEIITYILKNT